MGPSGLHSIANRKNPLSRQARSEPLSVIARQTPERVGPLLRSALNVMLRRSPLLIEAQGLATTNVCMRLFRHPVPSPSVRHLFAHFCTSRGARPRPKELHHDWFGSRRNALRNAGAWLGHGAGGG